MLAHLLKILGPSMGRLPLAEANVVVDRYVSEVTVRFYLIIGEFTQLYLDIFVVDDSVNLILIERVFLDEEVIENFTIAVCEDVQILNRSRLQTVYVY